MGDQQGSVPIEPHGHGEQLTLHNKSLWRVWQRPYSSQTSFSPSSCRHMSIQNGTVFPSHLATGVGRLLSCGQWGVQSGNYKFWKVTLLGRRAPSSSFPFLCWLAHGHDSQTGTQEGSWDPSVTRLSLSALDYTDGRNKLLLCLNPCCFGFQCFTVKLLLTNTEHLK